MRVMRANLDGSRVETLIQTGEGKGNRHLAAADDEPSLGHCLRRKTLKPFAIVASHRIPSPGARNSARWTYLTPNFG
jgi:hypothetical protein